MDPLLKSVHDQYDFIVIKRGTPYKKGYSFGGFSGKFTTELEAHFPSYRTSSPLVSRAGPGWSSCQLDSLRLSGDISPWFSLCVHSSANTLCSR
jgi:hypothetical protein